MVEGINEIDTEAPTAPTGLSAKMKGKNVGLSWNSSTDNLGVVGYTVWRDGFSIGNVAKTSNLDNTVNLGATIPTRLKPTTMPGTIRRLATNSP